MITQSEAKLEADLIQQLIDKSYDSVRIDNETELKANLKTQLEALNSLSLTEKEFSRVLNHLNKGNVFERAKILRDKMQLTKDDGTSVYLDFINQEDWSKNYFQVTNQVTMEGDYKTRYDVTVLINGLPLVQIELKRRGLEMKEAYNQTLRYIRHSYSAGHGLYQYIQIYVISNGVNTKYYANNRLNALNFKQTFFWANEDNSIITQLSEFANSFLDKKHLVSMITKYIVLAESYKILMVLRPYQYYATKAIVEKVSDSDDNGYIWHTTGSGKTLTSFKASQILMNQPDIKKVVFVVDRRDLDYQTTLEFNSFSDGSVDGTDNTKALVKQFGNDTKLLVTTIQKLNNAISSSRYADVMEKLKDEKIVFIFDECHRSQFGETHNRIVKYFNNHQMFGFTGTPIFKDNAIKNYTTKKLFGDCLHKYVITDAIRDENVLKFSVEYVGRYKEKEDSQNFVDIEVENIDVNELYESEDRLDKITDYIIHHHNSKTHSRAFTGMFCVSNVKTLIRYYDLFKKKYDNGEHDLKIATIFSYAPNEEDLGATGSFIDGEIEPEDLPKHSRDRLEDFIEDYNKMFGTKYSTKDGQSYYNYYNNISKRVKNKEIDILLVVNMFLTGFDSQALNTLYVDKNLKYHGLIQSYSRTNRILNERKSQGNIVVFRNLKKRTDDAISLFSNKDAIEEVLMKPYEAYLTEFNEALKALKEITPTIDSVNSLQSEEEDLQFITAFRDLIRIRNILVTFADFKFEDTDIQHQEYEDFKSKYLDVYEKYKSEVATKTSIIDDVDFELDLIRRDEINVTYILNLLEALKSDLTIDGQASRRKQIMDILSGDRKLRSKRELIEQFIDDHLAGLKENDDINEAFEEYWNEEKEKHFIELCNDEEIDPEELHKIVGNHIYSKQKIQRDDVINALKEKPKLLDRKPIATRIIDKVYSYIEIFMNGMEA
jgi:type I restriction enzyme R subunit